MPRLARAATGHPRRRAVARDRRRRSYPRRPAAARCAASVSVAAWKSASVIVPPLDSAASRAIVFSSWRTLPGQSARTRASISAGSSIVGAEAESLAVAARELLSERAECRRCARAAAARPARPRRAGSTRSSRNVPDFTLGGEVAVGRGDDAHVDLVDARPSRPAGSRPPAARAAASPASRAAARRPRRG